MKHKILYASTQEEYDAIDELIDAGWVLDPVLYNGKPFILDDAVVFPMVLYESDAEKLVVEDETGEYDDVESLVTVDNAVIDEYFSKGYKMLDKDHCYAKTTTLIKRREVKKDVV